MIYQELRIYYMSGTGNSYRISKFAEEAAKSFGMESSLIAASGTSHINESSGNRKKILGFVYPSHGFTMPWSTLKFVLRLPRGKSTDAFTMAARGSLRFGKLIIPGMSGTGTFIVSIILFLKGYNVRGAMSVNMPSNWSSLHPPQKLKNTSEIIRRAKKRVARFSEKIFSGKRVWFTLNNLYEIIFGILLFPISVGYIFIGRIYLAKIFFANSNCNHCGLCVKNCVHNGVKLFGKKGIPYWTYHCESCMKCTYVCPKNAIEAGHSWAVILFYIALLPASVYLLSFLNDFIPGIIELRRGWTRDILDALYWYPAMFISYFLFYLLMRIPFINWIFTHTTMTHFKFWGRYFEPDTKVSELALKNKD
ncbi:EFR1 family ferrodoxin [Bacteroidota bacterium]